MLAALRLVLCVSAGASALGGMLGMAGGIFIVPILTMFVHMDIRTRHRGQHRLGHRLLVRQRVALSQKRSDEYPARHRPGDGDHARGLTGVLLAGVIPRPLSSLFALILCSRPSRCWPGQRPLRLDAGARDGLGAPAGRRAIPTAAARWTTGSIACRWGCCLMYGAGLVSALLGIGSGVLKIPAMDTALRLPIKVSSATSNFMIGVTAAASAGAYFMRGAIVPPSPARWRWGRSSARSSARACW